MRIDVKTNFDQIKRQLDAQQKQATYAAAVALTRSAKRVQEDLRKEMQRVFHVPTRYTLGSLRTRPATKANLTATILFKDDGTGRGASQYLQPQIRGGGRLHKRFEQHLQRAGILAPGFFVVPGSGARLNANGNMSPGQITQILSGVQAHPDIYARSSKASRKRNPKPLQYFVSRGGALPYGIWQRRGSGVAPVMIFVRDVRYKKRFDFFGIGERKGRAYFPEEFRRAYADAIRTAR